jgi:acyl-CoA synthetase (AMP-forming)/AMP-acid ligase II
VTDIPTDNLTDNLASLLVDHPFADDQPLLHAVDHTVTAGAARADARALESGLRDHGVGPGQAVAVRLPNGPAVVTAMTGIWLTGAVFVPVNPRSTDSELARIVEVTDAAAIVDSNGIESRVAGRTYPNGTAFVLWTSGTTGAPKAILHTHAAYIELLDRVLGPLRAGTDAAADRAMPPMPNLIPVSLALNAGIYNVLFGLRAGAAVVIMDRFSTATFAELVGHFAIRSTVLPPAAMTMLNDDASIVDLKPLKYVRSITAPLSPVQARRFMDRFGVFVLNSYGQAEIGEVIGWTAADAKAFADKLGAAGRPHPGVDVKVVDGVLFVRPPKMAAGYAGGEQLDDRVDADGFVDTGDLASIDDDGFVWIEGRVSELINRGGNKVFPDDVEQVLRLAPGVEDAAVVGLPDDRLGEVPVAFVVGTAEPDQLAAFCRQHLVPYKVPVAFHRVDALPRTEIGKVIRAELVARHLEVDGPSED